MLRLFVSLFLLLAAAALSPPPAQAQPTYRGGGYYEDNTITKRPEHGYSGFLPGPGQVYCDYRRYPIRKCDKRGRCRAAAWRLQQYCRR